MYKTKLQEFCQKRRWELPEYVTIKDGPDHMPRFTVAVNVNGEVFETPAHCKSAKEAQNTAARIAFYHFDALHLVAAAPPIPPPDRSHSYKNLLQHYAQKENLGFPMYTSEAEGPPHDRHFKAQVSIGGKQYETLEVFHTLKEAEQAAAKVACHALSLDVVQEVRGLYKNLLQEYALKKGLCSPIYKTVNSGLSHKPVFVSTVEVETDTFRGVEAETKKQAEMNAAKVAYYALIEGHRATESSKVSSVHESPVADGSQTIQPTATYELHKDVSDEDAGCPTTEPSKVSSADESPSVDNSSENIHSIATIEMHQAVSNEEAHPHAKRAKFSSENMNENSDNLFDGSNLLSSRVENSAYAPEAVYK